MGSKYNHYELVVQQCLRKFDSPLIDHPKLKFEPKSEIWIRQNL